MLSQVHSESFAQQKSAKVISLGAFFFAAKSQGQIIFS
ncbi:MAG: hypothetical protein RLZZ433_1630 [Pseudomonadota bacterium]|jgi:hypothetical protein